MKILIIGTILTIAIIGGGVVLLANNKTESPITQEVLGLEVAPNSYDLGNVPINGGLVSREYEIKNTTDKTLKLKKIATSCMCTQAKVSINGNETKLFGMEGHGDQNPSVNLEVPSGATAKVTAVFDPAAHGPQGIGPVDRSVYLTFSDPVGVKELKFNGVVIQ
ncbi:DUF1573 domain-containing protein [Candidatus Woesebacteria bacterium]|nr:DUF1573 domain-containing protein [Candidatus Woesebacteria bacterium]